MFTVCFFIAACGGVHSNSHVQNSIRGAEVVYGNDSRQEFDKVSTPALAKLAAASVALVNEDHIHSTESEDKLFLSGEESEEQFNLCKGQRFGEQESVANCSGVLITPQRILTAAHCISVETCASTRFVFNLKQKTHTHGGYLISRTDIYSCQELIARAPEENWESEDFAIVELDRPAFQLAPVPFSNRDLSLGEGVFALGFPSGTPLKYAHGRVRASILPSIYTMAIDTFAGNSGSPVFDDKEKKLVGILVSGETDFITNPKQQSCNIVHTCSFGKCSGERVFKVNSLSP